MGKGSLHQWLQQDLLPVKEYWINHCRRTCLQWRNIESITAEGPASSEGILNQSLQEDLPPVQGLQPNLLLSSPSPTTWRRLLDMLIVTQTVKKYMYTITVHYCIHNSPPQDFTLSIINLVCTLTLFHKTFVNINLPPVVKFCKCFLSSDILL